MSDSSLTGSEDIRFNEIDNNWLVFQPMSSYEQQYRLFTLPVGQQIKPSFIINTGSFEIESGSIVIEKEIHLFDNVDEAIDFVNENGEENIASFTERITQDEVNGEIYEAEIQVINFIKIPLEVQTVDYKNQNGFQIKVFKSGSYQDGSFEEMKENTVRDINGNILNRGFSKIFMINSDIKDGD